LILAGRGEGVRWIECYRDFSLLIRVEVRGAHLPGILRSCTLMASTALEIAATSPTPFRTGASEVQFACCARFSGHRFRPTALGTWGSLFFMECRAVHRIFHDKGIVTQRLVRCKHQT
jgi:hypothetical protein